MKRFAGRTALVTGAASGIGRCTAERLAQEGAAVVVNDLRADAAEAVVATLPAPTGSGSSPARTHLAVAADVSDEDAVRAMFERVGEHFGRLDVLVNNAGVAGVPDDGQDEAIAAVMARAARGEAVPYDVTPEQFVSMPVAAWRRMIDIHLTGAFLCIREGFRWLCESDAAAIVNVSSLAGVTATGPLHYAAAKGGLLSMTRVLAKELGYRNVRVNAVCPGHVITPITAKLPDESAARMEADTPLGRRGQPEEIAATIAYLASEDASFVTGEAVSANGGIFTG